MTKAQDQSPDPNRKNRMVPLPRWSLVLASCGHALIFAFAVWILPWNHFTTFSVVGGLLASLHLATAGLAAAKARALGLVWKIASWASVLAFGWMVWELLSGASYLAGLYGSIGEGVGLAMAAGTAPVALFTLPFALWGIAATWRADHARRVAAATAVSALVLGVGSWQSAAQARSHPQGLPSAGVAAALSDLDVDWSKLPRPQRKRSLYVRDAFECEKAPADAESTVFAVFRVHAHRAPKAVCLQGAPDELSRDLAALLRDEGAAGPVKVDWVSGTQPLRDQLEPVDLLSIRPALDGVCLGPRCLMPWQLVARNAFVENTPLEFIPDLRMGFSARRLRIVLGDSAAKATPKGTVMPISGLARLETESFVVDPDGSVHRLHRLRGDRPPLDEKSLELAVQGTEDYIARANPARGDHEGIFRYTLDPYSGKEGFNRFNLPRQAGTTLVLCELGRKTKRNKRVVKRALQAMADRGREIEVPAGSIPGRDHHSVTGLIRKEKRTKAHLGPTALPAIAFLSCRDRMGERFDEVIAGMGRYLLMMQRSHGGFYPGLESQTGLPLEGPDPLFATGQAVFALTLLEKLMLDEPEFAEQHDLPPVEVVHDAVERAMDYFAGDYWDFSMHDFFFIEENWHCLAARASLGHHRHQAYEQFCLDYVEFKRRLHLDAGAGVSPELEGGYGFGNIVPPHNTASAGFGEALAAAMAIKNARGEDIRAEQEMMRDVIRFVMRQQWSERDCFACHPRRKVVGAISESMMVPTIRIDFVQHSWAAMGHGGRMLGLRSTDDPKASGSRASK